LNTLEEEPVEVETVQPEIVRPKKDVQRVVQRTPIQPSAPTVRNTRVPKGGIMVGGSANELRQSTRPPNTSQTRPQQNQQNDPWAVPAKVIKPGATISLKSGKKK